MRFMCILYFVLYLSFISINCNNKLLDFRQLYALASSLVCLARCIYIIIVCIIMMYFWAN